MSGEENADLSKIGRDADALGSNIDNRKHSINERLALRLSFEGAFVLPR